MPEPRNDLMARCSQFSGAGCGINAVNKITDDSTRIANVDQGNYEATWSDYTCGSLNEPWTSLNTLVGDKLAPIATAATGPKGSGMCFATATPPTASSWNQMGTLPLGDPKIDVLFTKAMTIRYNDLPVISIAQGKRLLPRTL
jgi:peptide/nickel transport system substrate-binding protein